MVPEMNDSFIVYKYNDRKAKPSTPNPKAVDGTAREGISGKLSRQGAESWLRFYDLLFELPAD